MRADFDQREALLRAHPRVFFITDHYRRDSWVLVRLRTVSRVLLSEVLEQAWRQQAPKRLVDAFDASS